MGLAPYPQVRLQDGQTVSIVLNRFGLPTRRLKRSFSRDFIIVRDGLLQAHVVSAQKLRDCLKVLQASLRESCHVVRLHMDVLAQQADGATPNLCHSATALKQVSASRGTMKNKAPMAPPSPVAAAAPR